MIPRMALNMPVSTGLTESLSRWVRIGPWRIVFYREGGDSEQVLHEVGCYEWFVTDELPRRVRRECFRIRRMLPPI